MQTVMVGAVDDDVIDLREYLGVLRRRWLSVVLVTILVAGAAFAFTTTRTPVYEGEVELVIEPVRRGQDVSLDELLQRDEAVETERRVIASLPVRQRVADRLDADVEDLEDALSTSVVPNSRVVRIVVTDVDADRAAALANAVAEGYLQFRRDEALATLLDAQETIDQRVEALRTQVADLDDRIADADDEDQDTTALEAERQSLLTTLGSLVAEQGQVDDAADLIGGGTVISPAEAADSPVSPKPARTMALGLVLGVMLGIGIALLRDFLDDVVRSEEDIERAVGDRPVLGRIPNWRTSDDRLATLADPHSPVSEAYSTLATNLKFLALGDGEEHLGGRVVVVTSTGPSEGKTSTAANLAIASARAGRVTMLIDADLRRPTVATRFGIPNGRGLTDALSAPGDLLGPVQRIGRMRLGVMTSGAIPPNPTDLVGSRAMKALIEAAREQVDLVVIDSPPLMAVADSIELAHIADAVMFVVRSGQTHRRALSAAVRTLASTGLEAAGIVVNGIAGGDAYGYGYTSDGYAPLTPPEEDDAAVEGSRPFLAPLGDPPSRVRDGVDRRTASDQGAVQGEQRPVSEGVEQGDRDPGFVFTRVEG